MTEFGLSSNVHSTQFPPLHIPASFPCASSASPSQSCPSPSLLDVASSPISYSSPISLALIVRSRPIIQMQEVPCLSTQFRLIPFRAQESVGGNHEEKAEDQLDRLTASVQQVLAGARMMQLDETEIQEYVGQTNAYPRPRLNSDPFSNDDFDPSGLHSPTSEYEPLDDEHQEILDFLNSLLEKTQMENEDLRGLTIRLSISQTDTIREAKRRSLESISRELGLHADCTATEERFVSAVKALLKPEINCTMEEISAIENTFFELLQNHTQDATVELSFGAIAIGLHVQGSTSEVLTAPKKRIAKSVGESLFPESHTPASDIDSGLPTLPPTPTAGHVTCERTIEDLRYRIQFMKEKNLPAGAMRHLDAERQRLYRANLAMRRETEKLETIRSEMESMRDKLQSQIDATKQLADSLLSERSNVAQLQLALAHEQRTVAAQLQSLAAVQATIESDKAAFAQLAAAQNDEVTTLKQQIEDMVRAHATVTIDLSPVLDPSPDGDLQDLDLRVRHMVSLIEAEAGNVEEITKELNEVEDVLVRVNPRRGGFRRVKVQLTSARNKLVNLKSKLALAQADKMMTNLNSTIKILGKTWKQQTPLEKIEITTKSTSDFEKTLKICSETPIKYNDFQAISPSTDEKLPQSKLSALSATVRAHEHTIARLRQQLSRAAARLAHFEACESRLSDKESSLRTMERQLEAVSNGLNGKMQHIRDRESALKARELSLVATEAAEGGAASLLAAQLQARMEHEDSVVALQRRDLELERIRVDARYEETVEKEQRLALLQQSLMRENLRIEKEKIKVNTMREDLGRLLPSLETLAKPKA